MTDLLQMRGIFKPSPVCRPCRILISTFELAKYQSGQREWSWREHLMHILAGVHRPHAGQPLTGWGSIDTKLLREKTRWAQRVSTERGTSDKEFEAIAMFMTPGLAVVLIAMKLLFGALIGFVVARVAYRSRISNGLVIKGALFGGLAFLLASGVAGWAGSRAAFVNGHRLDIAPWGEDLWLRNRIAENEFGICLVSACSAALLSGMKRKAT